MTSFIVIAVTVSSVVTAVETSFVKPAVATNLVITGYPRRLIQNNTLDERENGVNGSNNKINQSDILPILFSQGLKS